MDYSSFKKELAKGIIRPVYLFSGEEEFLASRAEKAIVESALTDEEKTLNLSIYYGRDAEGLAEALFSLPVFAPRKVTVVRQAQVLSGRNLEAVENYIKNPPDDGCLILCANKPDKRKIFYKKIAVKVHTVNCSKLRVGQLSSWMNKYVSQYGKSIDNAAIGKLVSINWPSLRELAGELERLTLMIGDKKEISLKDVDELGEVSFAFDRWALTDAIGSGDLTAAQQAAKNLQYWSLKPPQIVGDLYRLFHRLWLLNWFMRKRKLEQAKQSIELHPYVLKRYSEYARKIEPAALEDGLHRILDADLKIKRGMVRPDHEVDLLVIDLVQTVRRGRA